MRCQMPGSTSLECGEHLPQKTVAYLRRTQIASSRRILIFRFDAHRSSFWPHPPTFVKVAHVATTMAVGKNTRTWKGCDRRRDCNCRLMTSRGIRQAQGRVQHNNKPPRPVNLALGRIDIGLANSMDDATIPAREGRSHPAQFFLFRAFCLSYRR